MSQITGTSEIKGIECTPPHTWESKVTGALSEILMTLIGGDITEEKMLVIAAHLEQLHVQTLPLREKDPQKAFEVHCCLCKVTTDVHAASFSINHKQGKAAQRLSSLLDNVHKHIKELLYKHPPKDVYSFAQDFVDLPLHGLISLSWLDTLAEVWGPEEMRIVKTEVEKSLQNSGHVKGEFLDYDRGDPGSLSYQERVRMYPDLFLLLERKVEAFIKNQLPSDKVRDPQSLAALSDKLCGMGMPRGGLACLQSIPAPKPCSETENWYMVSAFMLHDLGSQEQSRELRWKFLLGKKDKKALSLYLFPWLNADALPTEPGYSQEVERIKEYFIKECEIKESFGVCLEWYYNYGFEDMLDRLMVHHLPRFSSYPKKIFEMVMEENKQAMDSGNPFSYIAVLLACREIIRRSWKSHYNVPSSMPRGAAESKVASHLDSDFPQVLRAQFGLVEDLGKSLTKDLLKYELPSHSEFVESLRDLKFSKRIPHSDVKRPSSSQL